MSGNAVLSAFHDRVREGWVNVHFNLFGSGEIHYSALHQTRESAAATPIATIFKPAYRIHVKTRRLSNDD